MAQEVDGETLLYVEATHQASCLNGPAARIWALCDGERTVEAIAAGGGMDPDVVAQAVKQLGEAGLLENGAEAPAGVDLRRRRMLVGVGLAAIPIILMITAPKAAHAASPPCTPLGGECGNGGTQSCCQGLTCSPPVNGTCQ